MMLKRDGVTELEEGRVEVYWVEILPCSIMAAFDHGYLY